MVEKEDFTSFDGTRLSYCRLGAGPVLLLLHGLFSNADTNWLRYGTAERLLDAGYQLILPDLRGHGASACPTEAAFWPPDVLALDLQALIAHLQLGTDFVLGGYSLGARTVVRFLDLGGQPKAVILAGMGLQGIIEAAPRGQWFINMIEKRGTWGRGSAEFMAEAFMKANIQHPEAILPLLRGQQSTPLQRLRQLHLPALVVCGAADADNGSAADLAAALPQAVYREIPGNHMNAITKPDLAAEMLAFLEGL